MPNDRFDLHAGAERHLKVAGNLPKHLAEKLLNENKRLRDAVGAWVEADEGTISERQRAREALHAAWEETQ